MAWIERTVDQSPAMQHSWNKRIEQAREIIDAARRLIAVKGSTFTLQELVKEAGVALKTFYRYFDGKDQLLLAVIEAMISDFCRKYEEQGRAYSDPIDRLRFYITTAADSASLADEDVGGARFVTAEHWRMHRLHPEELAQATMPFTELILREIKAGAESGKLKPGHPESDAWLINQLVTSVFHHYAFAPDDASRHGISDRVWEFLLRGPRRPAGTE